MKTINLVILIIALFGHKIAAQEKSYNCFFYRPIIQEQLVQKVSGFDSLVLLHGCPLEGCTQLRCRGVGFRKGQLYAIRIDFAYDWKLKKIGPWRLESKLMRDPTWSDSVKHIDKHSIISLNRDSLNFHNESDPECVIYDGGISRILFIKKDSINIQSSFNEREYQKCHYTRDRQVFIDVLDLLYKHYYFTHKERSEREE